MTDGVERSEEPFNRLSELAAKMTAVLETPENEDVKAIVMLEDESGRMTHLFGWEEDTAAMATMFVHMRAIFRSIGKDLQFVGIPESPEGLE